jgi:nicotinamidase/pyrazinamidase
MVIVKKIETASIDVDCQKGFTPLCPKELVVPEGDQIVNELNDQAKKAAYRIGSKDAHPSNAKWRTYLPNQIGTNIPDNTEKNIDLFWPMHCESGTEGMELLDGLPKPEEYNYFVWKGIEKNLHPYGAIFHDLQNKLSTGIIEFLKVNNVKTVICGGLAIEYCLGLTAFQLKNAGFNVIVNLGASRGISPEAVTKTIQSFKEAGIIVVNSASEITNE